MLLMKRFPNLENINFGLEHLVIVLIKQLIILKK